MKRILLFIGTNLAVLLMASFAASLLGVDHWLTRRGIDYRSLLIFSLIIGFSGSLFSLAISKWMAKMIYSIRVIQRPESKAEEWLVGKISEQAKASGIKMPEVGVYESPEVNAFATGPSRNNALVAVSSGLIHQMNLREIEGVLAHEMSHITNGDMVTMALLQGVVNTFVVFLSRIVGFALDQFLRRGENDRGIGMGYYIGSFVTQILLGILANMIVMTYSRRREFRADAGAARLEGKDAIISGLRRLQSISEGGGVIDDRSPALSAFKINGQPSGFLALLASHPPLEERIAALEKLP